MATGVPLTNDSTGVPLTNSNNSTEQNKKPNPNLVISLDLSKSKVTDVNGTPTLSSNASTETKAKTFQQKSNLSSPPSSPKTPISQKLYGIFTTSIKGVFSLTCFVGRGLKKWSFTRSELTNLERIGWAGVGAMVGLHAASVIESIDWGGIGARMGLYAAPVLTFPLSLYGSAVTGALAAQILPIPALKFSPPPPKKTIPIEDLGLKLPAEEPRFTFDNQTSSILTSRDMLHPDFPSKIGMVCADKSEMGNKNDGIHEFTCVTAAVLAQQFPDHINEFEKLTANEAREKAKELARTQKDNTLQWSWNNPVFSFTKYRMRPVSVFTEGQSWLFKALSAKFKQHPTCLQKLIDTSNSKISLRIKDKDKNTAFSRTDDLMHYIRDEVKKDFQKFKVINGLYESEGVQNNNGDQSNKHPERLTLEYPLFIDPYATAPIYNDFKSRIIIGDSLNVFHHDNETPISMVCVDKSVCNFTCVTAAVLAQKFPTHISEFENLKANEARELAKKLDYQREGEVTWNRAYTIRSGAGKNMTLTPSELCNCDYWLFEALCAKFAQHPNAMAELEKTGVAAYLVYNTKNEDIAFSRSSEFLHYIRNQKILKQNPKPGDRACEKESANSSSTSSSAQGSELKNSSTKTTTKSTVPVFKPEMMLPIDPRYAHPSPAFTGFNNSQPRLFTNQNCGYTISGDSLHPMRTRGGFNLGRISRTSPLHIDYIDNEFPILYEYQGKQYKFSNVTAAFLAIKLARLTRNDNHFPTWMNYTASRALTEMKSMYPNFNLSHINQDEDLKFLLDQKFSYFNCREALLNHDGDFVLAGSQELPLTLTAAYLEQIRDNLWQGRQ